MTRHSIPFDELHKYVGQVVFLELGENDWVRRLCNAAANPTGFILERVTRDSFDIQLVGENAGHHWSLSRKYILEGLVTVLSSDHILSNKGLDSCIKCRCATEMKRDFADMTVREFCPRCKF